MARTLKPIRWTLHLAATEFGLDDKTLAKRIKSSGTTAGKDGCFSTQDICRAVFGDIEGEKLRSEHHKANLLEMEDNEKKRQLFPKAEVYAVLDKIGIELKSNIMACNISEDEKRDILKTMQANLGKI